MTWTVELNAYDLGKEVVHEDLAVERVAMLADTLAGSETLLEVRSWAGDYVLALDLADMDRVVAVDSVLNAIERA